MARQYIRTMFSDQARARQQQAGSRASYARMEGIGDADPDPIGDAEAEFIAARDSFYIASVTPDGWPYVQHRGGPPGFLRHIEGNVLGFADFTGNRQYISAGNFTHDDRVSLFLMDYPARRRLKIIGHARLVEAASDPALIERLTVPGYKAAPERAMLIDVVGYDWNCPQHITPRFTEAEIQNGVKPLLDELAALRAEVARLRARTSGEAE